MIGETPALELARPLATHEPARCGYHHQPVRAWPGSTSSVVTGGRTIMTAGDAGLEEFLPPTALESSVRALGADTVRYRFDYLMLPMRDGVRLATVVIRPRAEGRYPTLMVRTPYATTSLDKPEGLYKALFEADYTVLIQNERGSEWSEGEFGYLTKTTSDAMDTLDWIAAQEWSNGRVGAYGCSSTAENQLKLGAIGHPALIALVPMSSGAGIGSLPGTESCQGLFFRGGVPMLKTWALWHAPFGTRMPNGACHSAQGS